MAVQGVVAVSFILIMAADMVKFKPNCSAGTNQRVFSDLQHLRSKYIRVAGAEVMASRTSDVYLCSISLLLLTSEICLFFSLKNPKVIHDNTNIPKSSGQAKIVSVKGILSTVSSMVVMTGNDLPTRKLYGRGTIEFSNYWFYTFRLTFT